LPYGEDWVDIQNDQATIYPLLGTYTFNGKEKDYESGFHYYGSRYYSSELSIWSSTDPMADKYPNLSPYNYCANNPVMLVDPNGEEIVISKNANKEQKEAFYLFAKTKEGIKELKKYAKAGQVIAGYTYKEDGIYHKKGVNLSIEGGELTDNYRNGETEFKKTDKGLKIGVRVSLNEISSGIIGKVKTYAHEIFIHGHQYSEDFKDDGVLNSSYIKNNNLKQRTISYQQHYMDKYIYKRFETNGLKLIKEAYQIYNTANPKNTLKIPNDAEIKKMMEYRLW
ncbi:MAG: RHS repeat-associated core domain-containing protein, partial [Bacteroidales bacterium]|nr:RHS repeat-associated core domain-containing protein [Bacteroidales bacterium]